jgi:hypothetical protein
MTMPIERQAVFAKGPRFFKVKGGKLAFEHVIDAGNIVGPRLATDEDKKKYPDALKAHEKDPKVGEDENLDLETPKPGPHTPPEPTEPKAKSAADAKAKAEADAKAKAEAEEKAKAEAKGSSSRR